MLTKSLAKKAATAQQVIGYICEVGVRPYGGYFEVFNVVEPLYYALEKSDRVLAEFAGVVMDAKDATDKQLEKLLNDLYQALSKAIHNY